ncbi:hypothetical protein GALMADRAFT_240917 [Galerina marginata CBS 339.88]|uniref:Uncharacterized protein n=1 Tax=Galerina marginata (strain CBS 339.88) TaxID=685588 RepID=A0A067TBS5_GALM3|nr:hypothetical protein GALMADRAFT_240917 [Galerina marginata CBS 339.88]
MLSFPAQNWEKALAPAKASLKGSSSGYGRVASRIVSRLYLSDLWTATNSEKLSDLGITHVISVLEAKPTLPGFISEERRLHLCIADVAESDILQHLDTTTAFIRKALEENEVNKVLVHCAQGISRSATVVCAYLVATTDMTAAASIEYIQSIRGIVCPNIGFRKQLDQYATRYVKLKPQPPPMTLPDVFKLGGGIAARIRKLKNTDKAEKRS